MPPAAEPQAPVQQDDKVKKTSSKDFLNSSSEKQATIQRESTTILKLQKESLRIEEQLIVAQRVVHFQREEAAKELAEAHMSKSLADKENLECLHLVQNQDEERTNRNLRKKIKNELLSLMNLLKEQHTVAEDMKAAVRVGTGLSLLLQQKRQAFQLKARNLEDREKIERSDLQASHLRAAKNLLIWQNLELRVIEKERRDSFLRENKLKAQQLKEIQQKEGEQLRELQHLKAKFLMESFNMEMENVEKNERAKGEELMEIQEKFRAQKKEKQMLKLQIKNLKEEQRNIDETDAQFLKGESLRREQKQRALQIRASEKADAKMRQARFDKEIKARAEEFDERVSNASFHIEDVSNHSNSSASMSQPGDAAKVDEEGASQDHKQEEGENIAQTFKGDSDKQLQRQKDNATKALEVAEGRIQKLKVDHKEFSAKQRDDHTHRALLRHNEGEDRMSQYRQRSEQTMIELIKLHNKEKQDMMHSHARELSGLTASMKLEKELHNKSISETEVTSRAKSEFLSFVCHELRNPLSGIVAIVEMLLSGDELSEELNSSMVTVRNESQLMAAIVNDVLDFAKIEANMLVLDKCSFNLKQMINELVYEQRLVAKRKNPDLAIIDDMSEDLPEYIISDPVRLRQILLNLVSNAVKFTYEGSITIKSYLESSSSSEYKVKFEIIDTGVGIAAKEQAHIFSAFSQANPSTTREFGGTGLGLSISKALIERLGGTVGVESKIGVGTKFHFTLTAGIPQERDIKRLNERLVKNEEQTFEEGMEVLIVEDSNTLRRLWAKLLKDQKCNVETASNGVEAIEMCKKKKYKVCLMDITMPMMSGDEAVKKLREMQWDGVVIALTANAMKADQDKYIQAGMDAVVTKPFQMTNLKKIILTQLEKRRNLLA